MIKETIAIKNGLKILGAISVFFLLMQFFGLQDEVYLRFFNVIIVYYFVNKTVRTVMVEKSASLLSVLLSSFVTSFLGVILSIFAFSIYIITYQGIDYLTAVGETIIPVGGDASLSKYCLALFVEGICSGVLVSIIVLQRWKNSIARPASSND
jgi:hypothetical protein